MKLFASLLLATVSLSGFAMDESNTSKEISMLSHTESVHVFSQNSKQDTESSKLNVNFIEYSPKLDDCLEKLKTFMFQTRMHALEGKTEEELKLSKPKEQYIEDRWNFLLQNFKVGISALSTVTDDNGEVYAGIFLQSCGANTIMLTGLLLNMERVKKGDYPNLLEDYFNVLTNVAVSNGRTSRFLCAMRHTSPTLIDRIKKYGFTENKQAANQFNTELFPQKSYVFFEKNLKGWMGVPKFSIRTPLNANDTDHSALVEINFMSGDHAYADGTIQTLKGYFDALVMSTMSNKTPEELGIDEAIMDYATKRWSMYVDDFKSGRLMLTTSAIPRMEGDPEILTGLFFRMEGETLVFTSLTLNGLRFMKGEFPTFLEQCVNELALIAQRKFDTKRMVASSLASSPLNYIIEQNKFSDSVEAQRYFDMKHYPRERFRFFERLL